MRTTETAPSPILPKIWEFWDGEPQLVERKEYTDENHP